MTNALGGLTVVDFSGGYVGAIIGMVLADYGADVIKVEPPQGDIIRKQPGFFMWHRGKKSIVLDLKDGQGLEWARRLASKADIVIVTFRPGVAERLGLGYQDLCGSNPGLIYASVTGFGTKGPHASLKGYDTIVAAKTGALNSIREMAPRPGPAYGAIPYPSWGAAQTALHGILGALYVRERTGRGQMIEATLVQGLCAHDTWSWLVEFLCDKYPDAYTLTPAVPVRGSPMTSFMFRLLVAMTKDGRWVQFNQNSPHLWRAMVKGLDLEGIYQEPGLQNAPETETYEDSIRLWDRLLSKVREKTLAEWQEHFRSHRDVGLSVFQTPEEAMDHPQMVHNGHIIELKDPRVGKTRQLAPIVKLTRTPGSPQGPAPDLGQHTAEVLAQWNTRRPTVGRRQLSAMPAHPLQGITVLELGLYFAAPYGLAILAELGARVIKLEPLRGDDIRFVIASMPETGAVKAIQGKESVAVDLETPEGQEIAHRLVRKTDLVMMSFRGGVARRMRVDYETLRQINPNIVHLHAPAYGIDGPSALMPAYAPGITVATGGALFQAGPSVIPSNPSTLALDEIKKIAVRLGKAANGTGNADGVSSLVVATALLLGLVARERVGFAQDMMTTMLCSASYAHSARMIQYEGKPPGPGPDAELNGTQALYRLYQASEGWVFLACPREDEWPAVCQAIADVSGGEVNLAADSRFGTPQGRHEQDNALSARLAQVFRTRPSGVWEDMLRKYDLACVEVSTNSHHRFTYIDPIMKENGFVTEVEHPVFGPYPRLSPLVRFSMTPGVAKPGITIGQHTEAVLGELGFSQDALNDLEARKIILRG